MVKFVAHKGKTKIIGLGLSKINMERLLNDKPILVKSSDLGLSEFDIEILIAGGETEESIAQNFVDAGMITADQIDNKIKQNKRE